MRRRKTTEEFIQESIVIHGDKYDYSKTKYISYRDKLSIICPKHGIFKQSACDHLMGNGCSSCAGNVKLDTNIFINRSRDIHYNTYDYSQSNYINAKTKVTIICPKHGEFKQTPRKHMSGQRCPKCRGSYKTSEDVIRDFKLVHNKYDYSRVNYINSSTKVIIICPKHGEFTQTPNSHLKGKGVQYVNHQRVNLLYVNG